MRRATTSAQHYLHGASATPLAHPSSTSVQQYESATPSSQPQAMQTQAPPTSGLDDTHMDIDFDDPISVVSIITSTE
jgi:hypothetical protein